MEWECDGSCKVCGIAIKSTEDLCKKCLEKGFTLETAQQKLKMYILIRDSVPDEFAPVVAAHGALGCYLKFKNDPFMSKWVNGVFYKVVCRVNDKEFEAAKQFENVHVQTEAGLGGIEATVTLAPRYDWPKPVRFYNLWKPQKRS